MSILKKYKEIFATPLQILIQRSLTAGVFPSVLKCATVIPIYKKKGARYDLNNFRPISLLPSISKIFEYTVHEKLSSYIEKNSLMGPEQHGFRKNRSTQSALTILTDSIKLSCDSRKMTGCVFFDFSKAFDLVNHKLWVQKLSLLGISGPNLSWIQSYLANRKLVVKHEDNMSPPYETCRGIPQGSILGPLLFCIYVNDITNSFDKAKCLLYADDLATYYSDEDEAKVTSVLQEEIDTFEQWCEANSLTINAKKTMSMVFKKVNKKSAPTQLSLHLKTAEIEPTEILRCVFR